MQTNQPIKVSEVLDSVESVTIPLLRTMIINMITLAMPGGIWAKIIITAAGWVFDHILIPAEKDLKVEAIVFLKKQELERKVLKYENAQTNQEFDDAFDDLLGGSKL